MLKAWYAILFAVSAALLLISMTVSIRSFYAIEKKIETIRHTREINSILYSLQSHLYFAESACRAYILSGNFKFLKNYRENENIDQIFNNLYQHIGTQSSEFDKLQALKIQVQERLLNLNTAVSLVQNQTSPNSDSLPQIENLMLAGTQLMNVAVTSIHELVQREDTIGSEADQDLFDAFQNTLLMVFASFILSLCITLGGFILLQRELSYRHETDKLNEEKNREIVSNRRKSEFMANMSHEIRTPLNAILGFAELLGKDKSFEENSKYLSIIQTSATDLHTLVNDILDLTRIESGKFTLNYEATNLREIASTVYSNYLNLADNKKIAWKLTTNPELPLFVQLDPGRVRQILINLTSNAFKFTQHGEIELSMLSRVIAVPGALQDTIELTFICRDTGIGIHSTDLEIIFSPFEQASKPHSQRIHQGTGLGLSITKKLVEMMGGSIRVESELERGTTFTVVFPSVEIIHETMPENAKNDTVDYNDFRPLKILIADDHPVNREVLMAYFKNTHHTLYEASDGVEAIEKAKTHLPDCILMDSWMPRLDGIQALKAIKRNPETAHVVLIAQTAFTLNNVEEKHRNLFDGYLSKPFTRKALKEELSKHFPLFSSSAQEQNKANFYSPDQGSSIEHYEQILKDLSHEMISNFDKSFKSPLKRLIEAMPLMEIGVYAQNLKEFSLQHPSYSPLSELADELEKNSKNFDIIKVEELLKLLYRFLSEFKSVNSEP